MLEADGYQPYLISPEKGLRSLIKGVLELAKEPSRLCVDEVNSHFRRSSVLMSSAKLKRICMLKFVYLSSFLHFHCLY